MEWCTEKTNVVNFIQIGERWCSLHGEPIGNFIQCVECCYLIQSPLSSYLAATHWRSRQTKIILSFVRYECETLFVSLKEARKLEVFGNNGLEEIFGCNEDERNEHLGYCITRMNAKSQESLMLGIWDQEGYKGLVYSSECRNMRSRRPQRASV